MLGRSLLGQVSVLAEGQELSAKRLQWALWTAKSLIRKVVGSRQAYVCQGRKGKKVGILTQAKEGGVWGEEAESQDNWEASTPALQSGVGSSQGRAVLLACLWANRKDLEGELLNPLHGVFLLPWRVRHVLTWGYVHSCCRDKMFPLKWDNGLKPWMTKCQVSGTHSTSCWNSGKGVRCEGWGGWGEPQRECETWTRRPSFKKSRGPFDE